MANDEGIPPFVSAQMSRGIAEITNLIDVALEDSNILVMASVSDDFEDEEIRKFLGSDNYYVCSIDKPNEQERASI